MKLARLLFALGIVVATGTSTAHACKDHTSSASAVTASNSGACTAAQAATCTAAQAAACNKAKQASAAMAAECPYHAHATTTAMTASAQGACSAHHAATAADAEYEHCGSAASAASGACAHGAMHTTAANDGCKGYGMAATAAAVAVHQDCDACADMAACERELTALGATSQVVPLKNGVMLVFTTDTPARVRAVQTALARRSERMAHMTTAGVSAHLCNECKAMRGAAASGKLQREVVNIEGGALTLMTSNDPKIVARLHDMSGTQLAAAHVRN
ncbi:MAG TPA: hypothetical protein VFK69_10010 [Candidatus Eisenbacteria bacterium]|nr:hypothetical protein [Candidatus Eisenbacteria bacterium]